MIIQNSVLLLKAPSPEDGPDKYESLLTSKGLQVKQVKTLVFEFKNMEILHNKLQNASDYSGIIFTSPRCVQAVCMSQGNMRNWEGKCNFVVGEATHQLALKNLLLNCEGKSTGSAGNLVELILESKRQFPLPFLMPQGNLKSDILSLGLGKENIQLDSIEVYDTLANPDIEKDFAKITDNFQTISEYVVFYSPSGFSSSKKLFERLPMDLNTLKFIALGPVTELALTEANFPVFGVAKRPNAEELLNVIYKTDK